MWYIVVVLGVITPRQLYGGNRVSRKQQSLLLQKRLSCIPGANYLLDSQWGPFCNPGTGKTYPRAGDRTVQLRHSRKYAHVTPIAKIWKLPSCNYIHLV